MNRMKQVAAAIAAVLVIALAVAGIAMYTGYDLFDKPSKNTATIGRDGGTYRFSGGAIVTVPPRAVLQDTRLTITAPMKLDAKSGGPLTKVRKAAVRFDISLEHGAEPLKPIGLAVPLAGNYLPEGVLPARALLYTTESAKTNLVSADDSGGVLRATLTHFSPKTIVYLDKDGVSKLLETDTQTAAPPKGGCGKHVTTPSTGKVIFGSGNKGWADGGDSPVQPCLEVRDGKLLLRVTNRANFILSASASKNLAVSAAGGGLDDNGVAGIEDSFFRNSLTKAYLARSGVLTASLDAGNLPAKVRLNADGNMVTSELLWRVVKLAVSVAVGDDSDVSLKLTKAVLVDTGDFVACVKGARALPESGNVAELVQSVSDVAIGTCGEQLANLLSATSQAGSAAATNWVMSWKKFFLVAGAVRDGIEVVGTALEKSRLDGDIDVVVQQVVPVQTGPCLSKSEFEAAVGRTSIIPTKGVVVTSSILCAGGWARARVKYTDSKYAGLVKVAILRLVSGRWGLRFDDDNVVSSPDCKQLPVQLKPGSGCP